jgi:hypothetical protein
MRNKGFGALLGISIIAIILIIAACFWYYALHQTPQVSNQASISEKIKIAHDSVRLGDMSSLKAAIDFYLADAPQPNFSCQGKTLYASAPVTPPTGWQAGSNMGSAATNGTGWIPFDFDKLPKGAPIVSLPLDPINDPGKHIIYIFACDPTNRTYELDMVLESQLFIRGEPVNPPSYPYGEAAIGPTDGGNDPNVYENGTDLTIIPDNFWGQ